MKHVLKVGLWNGKSKMIMAERVSVSIIVSFSLIYEADVRLSSYHGCHIGSDKTIGIK